MNKWSEIKQATLNKLFLNENEAQQQGYLEKFQYLANECLNFIANGVKPKIAKFELSTENDGEIIEMPDDFISFADIINTLDGEPVSNVIYVDDRHLKLPKKGDYNIYYNALWKDIERSDIENNTELPIDKSVLNCLPTYIASQLLSLDDVQRSMILKNEFELMLARLDTNIMYEQNHFISDGGWY